MLILNAIEKCVSRKSGKTFYKLYCTDDYDNGNWQCGSPMKVVDCSEKVLDKALDGKIAVNAPFAVGKVCYVMYNEYGYTSFIKFFDPDEKKQTEKSAQPYNTVSPPVETDYPFS